MTARSTEMCMDCKGECVRSVVEGVLKFHLVGAQHHDNLYGFPRMDAYVLDPEGKAAPGLSGQPEIVLHGVSGTHCRFNIEEIEKQDGYY